MADSWLFLKYHHQLLDGLQLEFGQGIHAPLRNCKSVGDTLTFFFLSSTVMQQTRVFIHYWLIFLYYLNWSSNHHIND